MRFRFLSNLRGLTDCFRTGSSVPRVLVFVDKPQWAYHAIANALIKECPPSRMRIDVAFSKSGDVHLRDIYRRYDLIFILGWQLIGSLKNEGLSNRFPFMSLRRAITGIHSHHAWDGFLTTPDKSVSPPAFLIDFLGKFRGVNAVSNRLTELFRKCGLSETAYTPNGVDTELFTPRQHLAIGGPLRVGFAGNDQAKHDRRKGYSEYIINACDSPKISLQAVLWGQGRLPPEAMPAFYNSVDVYLCASASEGFSLSVLEAAGCGRPVVSTRVGGSEDLIVDGENGFLVDRNVEAIRERLLHLAENRALLVQMGLNNRKLVEEFWSWRRRAPAWLAFIEANLP